MLLAGVGQNADMSQHRGPNPRHGLECGGGRGPSTSSGDNPPAQIAGTFPSNQGNESGASFLGFSKGNSEMELLGRGGWRWWWRGSRGTPNICTSKWLLRRTDPSEGHMWA